MIMFAEDSLQALEQLVTVMQSEVLLACATAAQAEQGPTDAETLSLIVRGGGHALAWEAEELRWHLRQLETVQVDVPWLRRSC